MENHDIDIRNLQFTSEDTGSFFSKTYTEYNWKFVLDGVQRSITLYHSKILGRRTIYLGKHEICKYQRYTYNFQYSFPIETHNISIIQSEDSYISDVIKKIPERFVFLAACNPYRAMGELNKIDHTLIHKGQEKRKLVYTVYPLPNNMLNFVLDFGNLSLDEEKKYIEIMISKSMEQIIVEKNKTYQKQIIKVHFL